ncbi:MAG: LacI family transcriptional regulator [Celeribacter sp.]|jgi:LacI family transcriptional regulator
MAKGRYMTSSQEDKNGLRAGERPTLKTISRITGLAVATVSRALNDAPDISQDTKKRVRACADSIDYLPNRAGVRLRTGKTNVISLVLSTEHDIMNHTAQLISSVAGALRTTPYHLIVTPFFPDEDPMRPVRYVVENRSADALIINQTEPDDARVNYLIKRGFPFGTHGRTNSSIAHPYADFDNFKFGTIGMEALARRGRKCILVLPPPAYQNYGLEILTSTKQAAERLGIQRLVLQDVTSDSPAKDIEISVRGALTAHPEIDGFFCASTTSTMVVVDVAETMGLKLGETMDVFSKEAISFLRRFRRDILTVHEDVGRTGMRLAQAVIQAIEAPNAPPLQMLDTPSFEDPMLET